MTEDRSEEHVPFTPGVHVKPEYYRPVRENPHIGTDADVEDVIHAFGVDCPRVAEAVRKLLRAGRKPREPRAKELAKACEHLQRELSFIAMATARVVVSGPISVEEFDSMSAALRGSSRSDVPPDVTLYPPPPHGKDCTS